MNLREELTAFPTDRRTLDYLNRVVPERGPTLGVSMPNLRRLARRLARGDFREAFESPLYYEEERIICCLLLEYGRLGYAEALRFADQLLPTIDNWWVHDCLVGSLKVVRENREDFLDYLAKYAESGRQFESRFVSVSLAFYFADPIYPERDLALLDRLNTEGYYARMGVAWCLAELMVESGERVLDFLTRPSRLDSWTRRKALTKALESYRVSAELKKQARALRDSIN